MSALESLDRVRQEGSRSQLDTSFVMIEISNWRSARLGGSQSVRADLRSRSSLQRKRRAGNLVEARTRGKVVRCDSALRQCWCSVGRCLLDATMRLILDRLRQ